MLVKTRQHTIHFLVSKFLNSKESLAFNLSGNDCYVLRYLADLMDMTNSFMNLSQCKVPLTQIITFTRLSRSTVQRSIDKLLRVNLLADVSRGSGLVATYTIGAGIPTCITQTQVDPVDNLNLHHTDAGPASNSQNPASHRCTSNKASNNLTKKEQSARPSVAPLSFFEPDDQSRQLAKDLRIDIEKELISFRERHRGKKTQEEFRYWLAKAFDYAKKRTTEEVRSTVAFWGPGHPDWERNYGPRKATG